MTPRRLGRYELVAKTGENELGELYLARPQGGRGVAVLRVVHPRLAAVPGLIATLLEAAAQAALIKHPNVVELLEAGEDDGVGFLAMEYLPGEALATAARVAQQGRRLDRWSVAYVIAEAAAGLHAVHEQRGPDGQPLELLHGDVSPSNVYVLHGGQIKLGDVGVARIRHTDNDLASAMSGYLPPEVLAGQPADRRSDVFALGMVMWEALTARRVYTGNERERLAKAKAARVAPPSSVVADVGMALDDICARALAHDPAARYPTAAAMHDDLVAAMRAAGRHGDHQTIARYLRETFATEIAARENLLRDVVGIELGGNAGSRRPTMPPFRGASPTEPPPMGLPPAPTRTSGGFPVMDAGAAPTRTSGAFALPTDGGGAAPTWPPPLPARTMMMHRPSGTTPPPSGATPPPVALTSLAPVTASEATPVPPVALGSLAPLPPSARTPVPPVSLAALTPVSASEATPVPPMSLGALARPATPVPPSPPPSVAVTSAPTLMVMAPPMLPRTATPVPPTAIPPRIDPTPTPTPSERAPIPMIRLASMVAPPVVPGSNGSEAPRGRPMMTSGSFPVAAPAPWAPAPFEGEFDDDLDLEDDGDEPAKAPPPAPPVKVATPSVAAPAATRSRALIPIIVVGAAVAIAIVAFSMRGKDGGSKPTGTERPGSGGGTGAAVVDPDRGSSVAIELGSGSGSAVAIDAGAGSGSMVAIDAGAGSGSGAATGSVAVAPGSGSGSGSGSAARPKPTGPSAASLYKEGQASFMIGSNMTALQLFQQAVHKDPRFALAYRAIGLCYDRMNDRVRAAKAYRQYLKLSPRAKDAALINSRLEKLP